MCLHPASNMPAQKGREWDAVVVIDKGVGNQQDKVRCLYCKSDFYGSATRIRKHIINAKGGGIGACKGSLPENFVAELRSLEKAKVEAQREAEIRKKLEKNIQSGKYVQKRIPDNSTRALKLAADKSLARFFYAEGIPFFKASSPHFKEMLRCVSKSPDYKPPERHTLSTTLLDEEYKAMQDSVTLAFPPARPSTLVSDGWKATNHEPLVNFIVCCEQDRYDVILYHFAFCFRAELY